ncbi:CHAP domain-containing protein [Hyphomonas johnsonii]|uniref:CHAP domain-containing protein n=1 Tax=Hyphomonas johnsonii MHS-2 TaxID=1280950 RepID=A0A059FHN8_9PROT|nr:CHAP domain-containing protein [Hyphomonas johnsonii]KCZ90026.1 CHAP domain-containing protein [Hyphomonas johnsonii MHS-2]
MASTNPCACLVPAFKRIALFSLIALFSASAAGAQTDTTSGPPEIDQAKRVKEICAASVQQTSTPTGSALAGSLEGLTNYYRRSALSCQLPEQSFVLTVPEQIRIVGDNSTPEHKRRLICRLADMLPAHISAGESRKLLGEMDGYNRVEAISCISKKITEGLSVSEVVEILGPIMPENDQKWSLQSYSPRDHISALCKLSALMTHDIDAQSASDVLGLARNYDRFRALGCFVDKLQDGLGWADVDLLVGASVSSKGLIMDRLGSKAPDGLNKDRLSRFQADFVSRQFLVDPDPPAWLKGQCVGWAKLAFAEVSRVPLNIPVGTARNIPAKAASAGLTIETDPKKARVGALIVWDNGGAGHVGIVTNIRRNSTTADVERIVVAESNWGIATEAGSKRWGIDLETAKRELVTDSYGQFSTSSFYTNSLDRPAPSTKTPLSYKFAGYVLPE